MNVSSGSISQLPAALHPFTSQPWVTPGSASCSCPHRVLPDGIKRWHLGLPPASHALPRAVMVKSLFFPTCYNLSTPGYHKAAEMYLRECSPTKKKKKTKQIGCFLSLSMQEGHYSPCLVPLILMDFAFQRCRPSASTQQAETDVLLVLTGAEIKEMGGPHLRGWWDENRSCPGCSGAAGCSVGSAPTKG